MFVFAIPLRSRESAMNWNRVTGDLSDTLQSILQQSSSAFRVIVACSDVPENLPEDSRVEVTEVPPLEEAGDERTIPTSSPSVEDGGLRDKHWKLKGCLVHLTRSEGRPTSGYVMPVDADDLVHREIVRYVENHSACGYIGVRGYEYNDKTGKLNRAGRILRFIGHEFHQMCGTCAVHPFSLEKLPRALDDEQHGHPIFTRRHCEWNKWYARRGKPLRPLPFPIAIYRQHTGENDRDRWEKEIGYKPVLRPLRQWITCARKTSKIRRQFGLPDRSD